MGPDGCSQHEDGLNAGGLSLDSAVKAKAFDIRPDTCTRTRTHTPSGKRQLPGYQVSNKSSQTPKQLQQWGRENDNYLNVLLFRAGGEGLWKDAEAVWMLNNPLMEKWQIPGGGIQALDGRERQRPPHTYAESIAGVSHSWHAWQPWKWVHTRNWLILDELWKESILSACFTIAWNWDDDVHSGKGWWHEANVIIKVIIFQFDRLKNKTIIIFNVHLHKVGFSQVSPNSIPGSKDMHVRLIGDASPQKLLLSLI